jgi:hypothetical protein
MWPFAIRNETKKKAHRTTLHQAHIDRNVLVRQFAEEVFPNFHLARTFKRLILTVSASSKLVSWCIGISLSAVVWIIIVPPRCERTDVRDYVFVLWNNLFCWDFDLLKVNATTNDSSRSLSHLTLES